MFLLKLQGIKIIVWSHGINLQKPNQFLLNQLYYLRQKLADALLIFTPDQMKFIKTAKEKVFIANNTLNFNAFPEIKETKEGLKNEFKCIGKKVILSVARFNMNNRKVEHLIELAEKLDDSYIIFVVGPGSEKYMQYTNSKINFFGPVYDDIEINKFYKSADIFCMPGAIGLAINQAFYYSLPVVVENVLQGPEIYYLKEGENGYFYNENDIDDLERKIKIIIENRDLYKKMSNNAKATINNEGSIDKMYEGFMEAIKYATK